MNMDNFYLLEENDYSSRIFNSNVSLHTTLYYNVIKYFIIINLMFLDEEDVRIVSTNSFFNKHPIPFNILKNGMYLKFTNINKSLINVRIIQYIMHLL